VKTFKFSPKYGLPNYRSGISVEFLAVKMTISCLATQSFHLPGNFLAKGIWPGWNLAGKMRGNPFWKEIDRKYNECQDNGRKFWDSNLCVA
jgi:hypothetical protein